MKSGKLEFIIAVISAILPLFIKRIIYKNIFKWNIDPSARIGLSLIWARQVSLGPGAVIGHFVILKNMDSLRLEEGALIGSRTYASAIGLGSDVHFSDNPDRNPSLTLGRHAAVTGRHVLDCNDAVTIGEYATLAGRETIIYTHGINVGRNRQESAPVTIGKYAMVGARCMIVKGAVLPDYSVLGAQSVLTKKMTTPYGLYAGNPATLVRELDQGALYFSRANGRVD